MPDKIIFRKLLLSYINQKIKKTDKELEKLLVQKAWPIAVENQIRTKSNELETLFQIRSWVWRHP